MSDSIFGVFQQNALLCSRIQNLKEIYMDFVTAELNVFHLDAKLTLSKFYGAHPDSAHVQYLAKRIATMCITLKEYPSIRFQGSSSFAKDLANTVYEILTRFKSSNSSFVCHGDDRDSTRERGQLFICDRTFDPVSPLMHEYTYQAMCNDFLNIDEGVVKFVATTGGGSTEKQALLNETDELWVELRGQHIVKVINTITEKMKDMLQNSAGAFAKRNGSEMSMTSLAAAIKQLPEYQQTMNKLGQHTNLAQQCMDLFTPDLMELTQLEQNLSTGFDEAGKEFKGAKVVSAMQTALQAGNLGKLQKIRLLGIFVLTQKGISGDDRRQIIQAARLNGPEQQILLNFEKIGNMMASLSASSKSVGVFGGLLGKSNAKQGDSDIADSRHVPILKSLLDQLISGNLPTDKFPALGPSAPNSGESKVASVRTRKFTAKDTHSNFSGGRFMVFVAGGICHSELRVVHELEVQHKKEIVVGGSTIINPKNYVKSVASIDPNSEGIDLDEALVIKGAGKVAV